MTELQPHHSEIQHETQAHLVRPTDLGNRKLLLLASLGLIVVYLLTGTYSGFYGPDAFTNAAQARAFADDQDPILEDMAGFTSPEFRGTVAWFSDAPDGVTSQYPPGTAI